MKKSLIIFLSLIMLMPVNIRAISANENLIAQLPGENNTDDPDNNNNNNDYNNTDDVNDTDDDDNDYVNYIIIGASGIAVGAIATYFMVKKD